MPDLEDAIRLLESHGYTVEAGQRFLAEEEEENVFVNLIGAIVCVTIAALAAGLTLGMLALDPLMLLIKERAGSSESEKKMARQLLPIVKQHHRLLVTLLLMNSIANEALPIFLEALVPPSVAILVSVTLVLFFGEIIPSAIFTGPNQLKIASGLVPVVRAAMCLLYPLAGPIAKMLDCLLHEDSDDAMEAYNRGELSALIRIQYEERLAQKRRRYNDRSLASPIIGALDMQGSMRDPDISLRESRRTSVKAAASNVDYLAAQSLRLAAARPSLERSNSIHVDEVTMVEGALQMKTRVALDVFTSLRHVYRIPSDLVLTEANLVQIYTSGFSRIPVYVEDPVNPKNRNAICGVLMTRQLILVNPQGGRHVDTLPLYHPMCVSPSTSLVDLLNSFQQGGKALSGGHLALVCARPAIGNDALRQGRPLPEKAGLMGVISLEDVLETLLQEQIYDEMDRYEKNARRLALLVVKRWKGYVQRRKTHTLVPPQPEPAMANVVEQAMEAADLEHGVSTETTSLLGK